MQVKMRRLRLMKPVKFIIAGFGFMGQTHAGTVCRTPGMELAAVVDSLDKKNITPQNGNLATQRISWESLENVPFFKTLEEALAKVEAQAVLIATPNRAHYENILAALDANKDVFVEKPLCSTLEEAYNIRERLACTQQILQVGFVIRFARPYCYLKECVKSKHLGSLKFLKMSRYTGAPAWWNTSNKQEKLDSALDDLGIHDIDFTISMLGEAEKNSLDQDLLARFNTSIYSSHWIFPGGIPVRIRGGFLEPSTVPFRAGYMAVFEQGMVEYKVDRQGELLFLHTAEESISIPLDPPEDPYEKELICFRDNVISRCESECNIHSAIRDMEWMKRLTRKELTLP